MAVLVPEALETDLRDYLASVDVHAVWEDEDVGFGSTHRLLGVVA